MKQPIIITGAGGLLGNYMCIYLRALGLEFIALDRGAFNDDQSLDDAIGKAATVLHFAGINRGTDMK